jgi:hypothetical protein
MNSQSEVLQETCMSETQVKPSRRGFLLAGAAAGATAAAVTALPKGASPEPAAAEPRPAAPENGGGYHVSEHVKRYYRTTLV